MKNNLLSLDELVSSVNGKTLCSSESKFVFTSVATDSRNVCEGSLFVPLIGENQNGHKYIPSAIEKGASVIFINEDEYNSDDSLYNSLAEKNCFIIVKNTLRALQSAAAAYVNKFPALKKVAVTGSSGKTTTKELIASCLSQKYNVLANEGNLNSETGLPLTAFRIRAEHEIGVFEMGMNHKGEISDLANIIKPNVAVITNIGTAHIGLLGSRDAIAREKKNVFNFIDADVNVNENGAAFIPAGDDYEQFLCEGVKGKIVKYGISVGEAENGIAFVKDLGFGGTSFTLDGLQITLPIAGKYNFQNALAAIEVAKFFGVTKEQIKFALENLRQISGRAEVENITLKNGVAITLFKDCYNANPDSMKKAIEFFSNADASGKKIFVLGDMGELGDDSHEAHKNIGGEIARAKPDLAIFVGTEMELAYTEAGKQGCKNIRFVKGSGDNAIAEISSMIFDVAESGSVLLLKASRAMRLERVASEICAREVA